MRRFGVRIPTRSQSKKPVSQRYGLFLCVNLSVYCGLAGIGLALLDFDNEPAASVVFAATKRDQAKIAHDEATRMVKASPALNKRVTVLRNNLTVKSTHSTAEPLSSDAKSADGLSVSCAVLDEFHAHKDADLLNVLKSATGARTNPLIAVITTAGFNIGGPCFQLMRGAGEVLEGKTSDDSLFALMYTLDDDDDFTDPSVWIKANPSVDVSIPASERMRSVSKRLLGGLAYGSIARPSSSFAKGMLTATLQPASRCKACRTSTSRHCKHFLRPRWAKPS